LICVINVGFANVCASSVCTWLEVVITVLIYKIYSHTNHVFFHESCGTIIVFATMTSVVVDGVILQQISYWC